MCSYWLEGGVQNFCIILKEVNLFFSFIFLFITVMYIASSNHISILILNSIT